MTQPRRRSTTKIVLIIVAIVFVVCCCGGGAGAYYLFTAAVKEPKATTDTFLDRLEAGNFPEAYGMLCENAQTNYGPEQFEQHVKQHQPKSHDLDWGGSYNNDNGSQTASISASITYSDGSKADHEFGLRKENGTWKVCGNPY